MFIGPFPVLIWQDFAHQHTIHHVQNYAVARVWARRSMILRKARVRRNQASARQMKHQRVLRVHTILGLIEDGRVR